MTIELPNFEGPLDLLLHLIRSQELDIYDIPIARITQQYLDYLQQMQQLNLQLAGEYFVMAATLLRIKSQYLLPKNDFVETEEDLPDPREELVEQLVQYSVFKKISAYFKVRNDEVPVLAAKEPSVAADAKVQPLPLGQISRQELTASFVLAMRRFKKRHDHAQVTLTGRPIQEMIAWVKEELDQQPVSSFFALSDQVASLADLVGLFLAILELVKDKYLKVSQKRRFGDLELERIKHDE
ncbi:segregation and condensation protein A [Lactobacillus nasalidis]|uniref:Segregation and condensation protein A n=2 Tax=Lactobacillus nasalidis TaxID=2797258 RepID=A0ABQ3W3J6_9LACO|nr:segregation and condensation protein A [Lactobacillus nasalidis]GHV99900.1 segregation and condensation protein A [Lactobacillus nasalidis]GHW00433.1 segregation and condensation protein A [Lactobacillus nasalidis]